MRENIGKTYPWHEALQICILCTRWPRSQILLTALATAFATVSRHASPFICAKFPPSKVSVVGCGIFSSVAYT